MRSSKRKLSIDTEPSINLHSSTHMTTMTQMKFPSFDPEPSTLNSSIDLSKLTLSQMNKKNKDIYKAILNRIEKQNDALACLEVEKLKLRVRDLEKKVNAWEIEGKTERFEQRKEFEENKCPLGPSHSLVKLKSKLKDLKVKKKVLKSERDEMSCELRRYKKMNKEMVRFGEMMKETPVHRGASVGSCRVF